MVASKSYGPGPQATPTENSIIGRQGLGLGCPKEPLCKGTWMQNVVPRLEGEASEQTFNDGSLPPCRTKEGQSMI